MKKKTSKRIKKVGKALLFVLKTPYFIGRGIYNLNKKNSQRIEKKKILKKRKEIVPKYEDFELVHLIKGDYEKWIDNLYKSESRIGIILGARGSGKTAFGIKFLENLHAKHKRKCFAMGFNENELPWWIKSISDVSMLENDSFVLIDEGGILFNSRSSMSNTNKILSQLIMIARHKNISILFISQNSSNLEVNILRQADFLVLKPSSLLQKEFERKIIQKIYNNAEKHFNEFKDKKGLTHIYSGNFLGFISNSLPSFWKEKISKSFK